MSSLLKRIVEEPEDLELEGVFEADAVERYEAALYSQELYVLKQTVQQGKRSRTTYGLYELVREDAAETIVTRFRGADGKRMVDLHENAYTLGSELAREARAFRYANILRDCFNPRHEFPAVRLDIRLSELTEREYRRFEDGLFSNP